MIGIKLRFRQCHFRKRVFFFKTGAAGATLVSQPQPPKKGPKSNFENLNKKKGETLRYSVTSLGPRSAQFAHLNEKSRIDKQGNAQFTHLFKKKRKIVIFIRPL